MRLQKILGVVALLLFAATPLEKISAESLQTESIAAENVTPHVIHVGLGYSYIPGIHVDGGKMTFGSVKHGVGYEVGYEYLFRKSWLSLGFICTGHYSGGAAQVSLAFGYSVPVDLFVHNFTPTIGGHWSWGKHSFKPSIGFGYLHQYALGEFNMDGRLIDQDGGFSSYFSLEYEYRPMPDTGIFVRIHEMDWIKEYNWDSPWEGIVDYGISVGFNFHF